jgi:hypothetical protein
MTDRELPLTRKVKQSRKITNSQSPLTGRVKGRMQRLALLPTHHRCEIY